MNKSINADYILEGERYFKSSNNDKSISDKQPITLSELICKESREHLEDFRLKNLIFHKR
jgi:hypothetical protein